MKIQLADKDARKPILLIWDSERGERVHLVLDDAERTAIIQHLVDTRMFPDRGMKTAELTEKKSVVAHSQENASKPKDTVPRFEALLVRFLKAVEDCYHIHVGIRAKLMSLVGGNAPLKVEMPTLSIENKLASLSDLIMTFEELNKQDSDDSQGMHEIL